jgi:hypothetical protein
MLETSRERIALSKAGIYGETMENPNAILNNFEFVGCNPQKINCWEFVGCGRELRGESVQGVCKASIDTSVDGVNKGKNGGRICWAISGTFCGDRIQGRFAKKLLSCKSCDFFRTVKYEEGSKFIFSIKNLNNSISEKASSI